MTLPARRAVELLADEAEEPTPAMCPEAGMLAAPRSPGVKTSAAKVLELVTTTFTRLAEDWKQCSGHRCADKHQSDAEADCQGRR